MVSNQYMDALGVAEDLMARKYELKYEIDQYMKKVAAYESALQEFKYSGNATTATLEELIQTRQELLDEQVLLTDMENELNTDIKKYQQLRSEVEQ